MKTRIAIFASGNGTNAERIIQHFEDNPYGEVALIFSNSKKAFVLERAKNHNIPHYVFNREDFYKSKHVDEILKLNGIDFIVLAGFMWLMPERFIRAFHRRIINIHPALLPKYGGKGMYGMRVHQAIVDNQERETGITIHWVNEKYDEGQIIFQAKCPVEPVDTAETVAAKVHELEYKHYPQIIEKTILDYRSDHH